jgi:hypothetical protein
MTTLQMNIIAILSGSFSARGNFSGYNAAGQRIHIAAQQMEALGHTVETVKTKPITFPLYTIAVEREFSVLDEKGEATAEKFTRLQAGSVFATKESAIEAYNADKVLGLETIAELGKSAKSFGLTDKQVSEIANASVL